MESAIKYLSFVTAAGVLGFGALFVYFSFHPSSEPVAQETMKPGLFGFPPVASTAGEGEAQNPAVEKSAAMTEITNRDGRKIRVRVFLPDRSATSTKSVDWTGDTPVVPLYWKGDGTFSIVYNSNNDFFGIGLLAEPLAQSRAQAETHLLQLLGLSEEEACRLNYSVFVSVSVNPVYANKNLGLSFCPGALGL